jgi:PAS domain S-box-containing protein
VNKAFEQITGYSSAEVKGIKRPFPWWFENQILEFEINPEKFSPEEIIRNERCFKNKNGERFWADVNAVPLWRNGQYKISIPNNGKFLLREE